MLTQTAAPSVHVAASAHACTKHPLAHVGDQAALLGNAHERRGLEQTVHRMLPAHQGLTGLHRAVGQPHDRLVEDAQLALVQRALQLGLQGEVVQRDGLRSLVEDVDPRAALLLGAVHRGIGLVEQGGGVRTVADREPEAAREARLAPCEVVRPAQLGEQPVRQRLEVDAARRSARTSTTNSSPPSRTAVSPSRTATDSRVATCRRTSSPAS